jgi:hypothetical protein
VLTSGTEALALQGFVNVVVPVDCKRHLIIVRPEIEWLFTDLLDLITRAAPTEGWILLALAFAPIVSLPLAVAISSKSK